MRILKLVLASVVVLSGVVTFVFMLFPSDIRISRVITINQSAEKIAKTIGDFKTWDGWNLFLQNPAMTHTSLSSPSSGKGAFIHSGRLLVTNTGFNGDTMQTSWQQQGLRQFSSTFCIIRDQGDTEVLQWYFQFHFKWYPWEKLGSMFYDKQLGPGMEKSLINLKHLVENNQ